MRQAATSAGPRRPPGRCCRQPERGHACAAGGRNRGGCGRWWLPTINWPVGQGGGRRGCRRCCSLIGGGGGGWEAETPRRFPLAGPP